MRTLWLNWLFSAFVFVFLEATTAHAERLEDFPRLLPSTTLYGDCGPVPRCFPSPDDLEPNTAVIGSSGQVSIYERQAAGQWQLQAALLDPFAPQPRPFYNSNFGYLASIDADLLAVAATPSEEAAPVIYVFRRNQTQWSLLQTLRLSSSFGDVYLKKIEIKQDTLLISQIEYANDTSGRTAARVLLYSAASDGVFRLEQQLDPGVYQEPDAAYNIALEENTLALAMSATATTAGSVYIYRKTAAAKHSFAWRLQQVIRPRHLTPAAGFGSALALSGDTLAVSAPREINSPPTLYPGAIYIYSQPHGRRWNLQARVVDPVTESDPPSESNSPPAENPFGTMLSLSGTRLLAKHISNAYAGEWSSGILFERQPGSWAPIARLSVEDTYNVQNTMLAGTTALLGEAPYDGIFPASLNVYELPAPTEIN